MTEKPNRYEWVVRLRREDLVDSFDVPLQARTADEAAEIAKALAVANSATMLALIYLGDNANSEGGVS